MFYEDDGSDVMLYVEIVVIVFCAIFVGINLLIGILRYRKIKNNKTVGTHSSLTKLKLNQDIKCNDYNIGLHVYADKEKNKWVLIVDNPKQCDIYSFQALEDYVLTVNGEFIPRSSMKNLISKVDSRKINNITLDVFCKNKKYRFQFLTKECNLNDNTYNTYYASADKFCDIFDYILENK